MHPSPERDRLKLSLAVLILCAAVVSLVVYFALCFYAYPLADDFVARSSVVRDGVLKTTQRMYLHMTGRWTAMFVDYGLMRLVDPTRHYALIILASALFNLAALYAFWRALLARELSRIQTLALAVCALVIIWSGMPDPGEALFWFSGYCTYLLGVSLLLFLLAAIASPPRVVAESRAAHIWYSVALVVLAVVVAGVNELIALTACLIVATAFAFALWRRSPHRWLFLWTLAGCAAGLVIVLAAPGNYERAAMHSRHGDIPRTLALVVDQLHWYSWQWVRDLNLWGLTAIILSGCWTPSVRPPWLTELARPLRWVVPILGTLLVILWFALTGWALGDPAPGRTASTAYVILLFASAGTTFLWRDSLAGLLDRWKSLRRFLMFAGALMLALGMVTGGNAGRGMLDLKAGRPQAWNQAMRHRDAALRGAAASGIKAVVVPAAPEQNIFSPVDIHEDPTYWVNRELSRFYGLTTLRLAPASRGPSQLP